MQAGVNTKLRNGRYDEGNLYTACRRPPGCGAGGPGSTGGRDEADPIRWGWPGGSGALVNANLENNTGYGSGYRLGYFDRDLDFVELGRTGSKETRITMVKAQNTWVSGSSYSNSDNGGAVIGSYHLQVETCSSYEEAVRAAEDYPDGFPAWIDGEYQVGVGPTPPGRRLRTPRPAWGGPSPGPAAMGST